MFELDRRKALFGSMAGAVMLARPQWLLAQARIPQRPSKRVIVDNDFAGDPDGLVGLAHQLLSPKTIVPLITVSGLSREYADVAGAPADTVGPGIAVVQEMQQVSGLDDFPALAGGHEAGERGEDASAAAVSIIQEAMRDDPLPLVLACGGPLTNVAEALRLEPAIADRMSVIWIGGGAYPDGAWEYNLSADVEAARHVLEETTVEVWQVPQPAYRLMQVSVAEMEVDMRPISPFTEWLYEKFTSPPDFVDLSGTWPMGDSPPVLFTAISEESSRYREWMVRRINDDMSYGAEIPGRTVRVYDDIDMRLTWADFLAKLRLHAASQEG